MDFEDDPANTIRESLIPVVKHLPECIPSRDENNGLAQDRKGDWNFNQAR